LLNQKVIGDILSVHFEWTLDTWHGADYFRRWHRDIANSGGLMVHKASHHFDLVNWWLDSQPETVVGFGDLRFYGRANGEARGLYRPYRYATGDPASAGDPYAHLLEGREKEMYLDASVHDGYRRDQNVFGDGITIQDDMAVMVRYRNRATLSYHLTAYSPWEGWRCMFNGSNGRLEVVSEYNAHAEGATDPSGKAAADPVQPTMSLIVRPLLQQPYRVEVPIAEGSHGGSDDLLMEDMFVGGRDDPLNRAASYADGLWAIATGISANHSFQTGQVVRVADLFGDLGSL
jgi:predicted dehydrogenase